MTTESFFAKEGKNSHYEDIRLNNDTSHRTFYDPDKIRESIEELWNKYQGYNDKTFLSAARNDDFIARLWEMYLTCALLELGINVEKKNNSTEEKPDIKIKEGATTYWIEAISPDIGDSPEMIEAFEQKKGKACDIPDEETTFRLLLAVAGKTKSRNNYVKNGILSEHEPYIIAINGSKLNVPDFDMPRLVKGVFGIGMPIVQLHLKSGKTVDSGFSEQKSVKISKGKGFQEISKTFFIDDEKYDGISALLYSDMPAPPFFDSSTDLMSDYFYLVHNPRAKNPLPHGFIKVGTEYWIDDIEKITPIEKIEIEGLWEKYHIEWHLNPDVNILAGINGSGKSTVLNIITGVLTGGHFVGEVDNWINGVKISFNDNKNLYFPYEIIQSTQFSKKILNCAGFKSNQFRSYIHEGIISDVIKIHRISTFEQPIKTQSETRKYDLPEKIKTDLDIQIFELQRTYLSYQINLGKRVEQIFSEGAPIDIKTKREEIYGKKELFTQTINNFFAQTGKTIASDENNEIVFRQNGKILTPYQLSSGEKQVLLILLSALIQDNEPYILIMDEPEISLHIDWQEQLIQVIRSLNENVQVILATHSPALVMKGWMDKVTEMEDITRQEPI